MESGKVVCLSRSSEKYGFKKDIETKAERKNMIFVSVCFFFA